MVDNIMTALSYNSDLNAFPNENTLNCDSLPINTDPLHESYSLDTHFVELLPEQLLSKSQISRTDQEENLHIPISIITFNIEGIIGKLNDEDFIELINKHDIVCLQETFINNTIFSPQITNNFEQFLAPAIKLSNQGRPSGGVIVFVKRHIKEEVEDIKVDNDQTVVLKLNKKLFNTPNDVLLVTTYVPPQGSPYYNNKNYKNGICQLEQCIADLLEDNNAPVILCGDLNARTKNAQPLNDTISTDYTQYQNNDIQPDETHYSFPRKSDDSTSNTFGNSLCELCGSFDLVIINGTEIDMSKGNFTYISNTGNSVVDYFILSQDLLSANLEYNLDIKDSIQTSHQPVVLTIQGIIKQRQQCHDTQETVTEIRWDNDLIEEFKQNLTREAATHTLEEARLQLENNNPEAALDHYQSLLLQAASCMAKTRTLNKSYSMTPGWFDRECKSTRYTTRRALRKYKRHKRETDKIQFMECRKRYKLLLNTKRKEFNQKQARHLTENINNPAEFWKTLKKTSKKNHPYNANITSEQWSQYFENLHNVDVAACPPICNEPIAEEHHDTGIIQTPDEPITELEVRCSLKSLKTSKACGKDGIYTEMIKNSQHLSVEFLVNLFNTLFTQGIFPIQWSIAIIVPIFKKGDLNNPGNYRGISLLSVISKIYTRILNRRLVTWCNENSVIREEQAGFRQGYATIDHIFTLFSMVQKQFQMNRKLYVAFVDFQKAFDSINREALWNVLKRTGLSPHSNLFKSITSIYHTVKSAVRFKNPNSTGRLFDSTLGVKQGCVLSPQLFLLFINELAGEINKIGKHGIQLIPNGPEIYLLLFADDLVLVSHSPTGLQNQLNALGEQTTRMGLNVNQEKTKIMVFRKGGYLAKREKWSFLDKPLEVVNSYKYLGIEFSTRLSINNMVSPLINNAKKVCYEVIRYMKAIQCQDLDVFLSIFNTKIQPIILYGSEVWGVYIQDEIERVHTFALKRFLQVSVHSSNTILYGETGRHPLSINAKVNSIRYWTKLQNLPDSRFAKQAYLMQLNMLDEGYKNWVDNIKTLLIKANLSNTWEQPPPQDNSVKDDVREYLKHDFVKEWGDKLSTREELATYRHIKTQFGRENYLSSLTFKPYRDAFIKFRLGVSPILTHINKYTNKPTICPLCLLEPEGELHFLLICEKLEQLRQSTIPTNLIIHRNMQSLKIMLQCSDSLFMVSKFIFHAIKLRSSLIAN